MAKIEIPYTQHLDVTFERMNSGGILLMTRDRSGRANPMTVGWGTVGVVWGRHVFCVLVRPSRYSFECLEANPDFTVNVQPADRADIVEYCGTHSGRRVDKCKELGLSVIPSKLVKTPIIEECNLHYECKVIHKNDILLDHLHPPIIDEYYPKRDNHRVYFGEILRALKDERMVGAD